MKEQVGTLLWELRMARGWSLGQLAQRSGISKAALSRWESGDRIPRIPELEAVLDTLEAGGTQRAQAFARIEAPRALRILRSSFPSSAPGPLPAAGDLVRAMRQRKGWTQQQTADQIGVQQHTVARWELGERLPAVEEIQALCFALGAHEEELIALTMGRFADTPEEMSLEPEAVTDCARNLLYDRNANLQELRFLTLERMLWKRAVEDGPTRALLASVYAHHAHYLSNSARWAETGSLAKRALDLLPRQETEPDFMVRAALKAASAAVFSGNRPAPERGLRLLESWLPRVTDPDYCSWILSVMASYIAIAGQPEKAAALAKKAVNISEAERRMRLIDYSDFLVQSGCPSEALDHLPDLLPSDGDSFVYAALIRSEAHLALAKPSEAHEWLRQAYAVIETERIEHQRPQADALASRF